MYGTFAAVWVVMFFGGQGRRQPRPGDLLDRHDVRRGDGSCRASSRSLLERFAYRPLRKRNAPPLIALISAIGASFVLSELMGLRQQITKLVGFEASLRPYVANSRNNTGMPEVVSPQPVFTLFDYQVTNIDIFVIVGAIVIMIVLDQFVQRSRARPRHPRRRHGPGGGRPHGRQPRPGHPGDLPHRRHHGRCGGGLLHAEDRRSLATTPASSSASRRSPRPSSAASATCAVPCSAASSSASRRTTARPSSARSGRTSSPSSLLVLILLFRPTGLLGESLGKARA